MALLCTWAMPLDMAPCVIATVPELQHIVLPVQSTVIRSAHTTPRDGASPGHATVNQDAAPVLHCPDIHLKTCLGCLLWRRWRWKDRLPFRPGFKSTMEAAQRSGMVSYIILHGKRTVSPFRGSVDDAPPRPRDVAGDSVPGGADLKIYTGGREKEGAI